MGGGTISFKLVDASKAAAYQGLSVDETLVMQAVERAGNTGVWTRSLKLSTKLQQTQLTRILKRLEARKLIKAVKSITHKNRKMYMAFHVAPSKEVTGGPWYQDQELDHVFIETLRKLVYQMVQRRGPQTRVQIQSRVAEAGVSQVPLSVEDIQQILDTLIYDGKLEVMPSAEDDVDSDGEEEDAGAGAGASSASSAAAAGSSSAEGTTSVSGCTNRTRFKVARLPEAVDAFTSTPCGVCPVFEHCSPGGVVSPEHCVYLDGWLDF